MTSLISVLVCPVQLEKPEDESYVEFWVDFNAGSERVSLFCNQVPVDSQVSRSACAPVPSVSR